MWAIKKYCGDNADFKWPIENAHDPVGAPDGFEGAAATENTGMKVEAGRTKDAAVTENAATDDADAGATMPVEDDAAAEEAGVTEDAASS